MSPFEAAMIICFGGSWPVAIWKTLKTKQVHGKSLIFLALVASGYGFGMIHKALHNFDWVIFLYAFNFLMVLTELGLCAVYGKQRNNELFDPNATADTLFDEGEVLGEPRQPALRLVSIHDSSVANAPQTAQSFVLQPILAHDLRSHG